MSELYRECRALYEAGFPGESEAFTDALFDAYFPDCVRMISCGGEVASMLFSIPYPVQSACGVIDARYLYGVVTHPAHRGKGLARELIAREAASHPVFLRPMQPSLFDFYARAGLLPFSPIKTLFGLAGSAAPGCRMLTPGGYLALRDRFATAPVCRMTGEFLGLALVTGGLAAYGEQAAALYDREGDTVIFKEWWGDPDFAPRLAAFLSAARYELRLPHPDGEPFGVMSGLSQDTVFLAAMD